MGILVIMVNKTTMMIKPNCSATREEDYMWLKVKVKQSQIHMNVASSNLLSKTNIWSIECLVEFMDFELTFVELSL